MTPREARKMKPGTVVTWRPTQEHGKVIDKGEAGIRVMWDDGTNAVYLYAGFEGARGLTFVDVAK